MGVTAPSGFSVSRNGSNYTLSWKLGQTYTAQVLMYRLHDGPLVNVPIASNATSKVITIPPWEYSAIDGITKYPVVYHFYLYGRSGSSNSSTVGVNYTLYPPPAVTGEVKPSTEIDNETTFSWRLDWNGVNKDTGNRILYTVDVDTALLVDSNMDANEIVHWKGYGGFIEPGTESGDIKVTETIPLDEFHSYTRYMRITSYGPGGRSMPAFLKRVYAIPNSPKNVTAKATVLAEDINAVDARFKSGYMVTVGFDIDVTKSRPVDEIRIDYAIAKPITTYRDMSGGMRYVELAPPPISSWTTASVIHDDTLTTHSYGETDSYGHSFYNPYQHVSTFVIDHEIDNDKWVFVRVVSKYEKKVSASSTVFVDMGETYYTTRYYDEGPRSAVHRVNATSSKKYHKLCGYLSDPSGLSAQINGNIATITVNNNSDVDASWVGIYYRSDKNPNERLIGIKPAQSTTAISVQLPDDEGASSISLGAKAMLASYMPSLPASSGVTDFSPYTVYAESFGIKWDDRPVPKPPTNIRCSSPRSGTVRITWDWSWLEANGVELSWADHEDAWESTDGPTTHSIENQRVTAWNITGLSVGQWYFRIRLYKMDGDGVTYGTYSAIYPFKLSSTPMVPALTVSPSTVAPDGKVTCYWSFIATEGDEQLQADICEATIDSEGTVHYGDIITSTSTEQFKTINVEQLEWAAGSTHYLAVRTTSIFSDAKDNWSAPQPVKVFDPVNVSINSTSLETIIVVDDEEQGISHQQLSLTEMPFNISASGVGAGGTITYILERAGDYRLDRPDEDATMGFAGETVAIIEKTSVMVDDEPNFDVSIQLKDLVGRLDDGAYYNLIVIASDSNGQISRSNPINFAVHWKHQAVIPSANVQIDNEDLAVFITPTMPESGYADGDTCDIYRLSIDKPVLIVQDASFGTTYVDPFPTLGDNGGHRVVYKTGNGDYITEDNRFAWVDIDKNLGDIVDKFATIIDFGDDRVILPYDLSLSSKWSKDFTQTKYLGGSIEGDWNPAVEKSVTVNTRIAVKEDSDLIETMRKLAVYSGVCHVRTPDGSSFAANVDVSEDREEKKINMIASFSLDIQRVDAVGFDGVPYTDWIKGD